MVVKDPSRKVELCIRFAGNLSVASVNALLLLYKVDFSVSKQRPQQQKAKFVLKVVADKDERLIRGCCSSSSSSCCLLLIESLGSRSTLIWWRSSLSP